MVKKHNLKKLRFRALRYHKTMEIHLLNLETYKQIYSPAKYTSYAIVRKRCIYFIELLFAGLSSTFPLSAKREPWQAQSHECSTGFHLSAQPRWGHRFWLGVSKFFAASNPLIKSCGLIIFLDGLNIVYAADHIAEQNSR